MKRKPTLGNKAAYITLIITEKTLSLLPVAAVWHMGAVLGQVFHALTKKRRNIVLRNLTIAKPELSDNERKALAKDVFRHSFANLLSSLKTGTMPVEKLQNHITLEGNHILENLDKDKGCVFMLCHMGNWEVLTRLHKLSALDKPTGAMFQTLKNPYIDTHIQESRESEGTHLFSRKHSLRNATKFVKEGGTLGILSDQNVGKRGVSIELFNKKTRLTPIPAMLSQSHQCPIVPISVTTTAPGKWKISIEQPFHIDSETSKEDAVALMIEPLEKIMSTHAKDIFWLHNLWK